MTLIYVSAMDIWSKICHCQPLENHGVQQKKAWRIRSVLLIAYPHRQNQFSRVTERCADSGTYCAPGSVSHTYDVTDTRWHQGGVKTKSMGRIILDRHVAPLFLVFWILKF
jgi:hypothetical protein